MMHDACNMHAICVGLQGLKPFLVNDVNDHDAWQLQTMEIVAFPPIHARLMHVEDQKPKLATSMVSPAVACIICQNTRCICCLPMRGQKLFSVLWCFANPCPGILHFPSLGSACHVGTGCLQIGLPPAGCSSRALALWIFRARSLISEP